ncbi:MAG: hypothetical protein ACQEQC_02425 [Elusimicrobiota bacterium]
MAKDFIKEAVIYKNDKKITTVGEQDSVKFSYSEENKKLKGIFPVPRKAKAGVYNIKLFGDGKEVIAEDIFYITSRISRFSFEKPLKVFNLESSGNIHRFNIPTPAGETKDYEGIFDWINYVGGNTLWYMAAQTASYSEGDIDRDLPWVKDNISNLKEFAAASQKEGVDFGAWITCFRTFGISSLKPEWYNYSYKYSRSSEKLKKTDGISILDGRRYNDIKKMARRLNENSNIDYIGLDYIRPAGGGLELVNDFVKAMEIDVPVEWNNMDNRQRMIWLGEIVTRSTGRKISIIDKWNWWRAHRISKIINRLKKDINFKKPLWTFTLSWELGHEHGQDPIMFQDAGADLIAVMMYETDTPRYNYLIRRWRDYTKAQPVNLVMGNQIDWPLHQYTIYPSGPSEFNRRLEKGIDSIREGKFQNLTGVFINDFSRAMWGRKGPYSSMEWMLASGRSFTKIMDTPEVDVNIIVPRSIENNKEYSGQIKLNNLKDTDLKNIKLDFPDLAGINLSKEKYNVKVIKKDGTKTIKFDFKIEGESGYRLGRYMIGTRVIIGNNIYVDFKNLWVKNIPLDILHNHR